MDWVALKNMRLSLRPELQILLCSKGRSCKKKKVLKRDLGQRTQPITLQYIYPLLEAPVSTRRGMELQNMDPILAQCKMHITCQQEKYFISGSASQSCRIYRVLLTLHNKVMVKAEICPQKKSHHNAYFTPFKVNTRLIKFYVHLSNSSNPTKRGT